MSKASRAVVLLTLSLCCASVTAAVLAADAYDDNDKDNLLQVEGFGNEEVKEPHMREYFRTGRVFMVPPPPVHIHVSPTPEVVRQQFFHKKKSHPSLGVWLDWRISEIEHVHGAAKRDALTPREVIAFRNRAYSFVYLVAIDRHKSFSATPLLYFRFSRRVFVAPSDAMQ